MDTITIRIDSLSYGGSGVGRHEGIVYFIPFSVPGDLLEVKITKKEKRYREAVINRIIEASPDRVEPICPYFGECGGCQWQQVRYDKQLECKSNELQAALRKSRLDSTADRVKPIAASPEQFGYRRTARFKTSKDTTPFKYGFYRAGSRELIRIDRCPLLDERINSFLPSVKPEEHGMIGFDLFLDDDGKVHPFYRFSERDQGADFFQVNSSVNKLMLEYISETIRAKAAETGSSLHILDLFCGDGNLSMPFADTAASITGWDNSRTAIERGRRRADQLMEAHPGCRIRLFEADVARSWKSIAGHARQSDCIIIDPPRRGLKDQTARLAGLRVPLIIYISCSPPALIRDLVLFEKAGYEAESLQPFDMFPQTYHLETVAVLRLRK